MEFTVIALVAGSVMGLVKLGTTRSSILRFIILAALLLATPVALDILAKIKDPASSAGIQLLLYWPFDFAYIAFAVASFSVVGWLSQSKSQVRAVAAAGMGAAMGLALAILAFIVVAQVHTWGGGRL